MKLGIGSRIRICLILMSQCGTGLMYRSCRCVRYGVVFYRTFRSVRYRYRYGIDVVPIPVPTPVQTSIPVPAVPVLIRTELTELSGTGIDPVLIVPNLTKGTVPVLMLYRTYRSVQYRYESMYRYRRYQDPRRTELAEVFSTGIDVVPNLPKCPVPVLTSYRIYRSVR